MDKIKQRVIIAQFCGYYRPTNGLGWRSPQGFGVYFFNEFPDYLNDLNAIHEAENRLSDISPGKDDKGNVIPSDKARYRMELCLVCVMQGGPICAMASQRAEALIKTIGKWQS